MSKSAQEIIEEINELTSPDNMSREEAMEFISEITGALNDSYIAMQDETESEEEEDQEDFDELENLGERME